MKKLIIALLILPIVLFAGEPIPGIDVIFIQISTGTKVKGKTNGRGEFIATGLKEGDYKVTIEMNGVSCVIGEQVNEKISLPSTSSTASIKPVIVKLSTKSMFFSKKGYDYYASKSREAGSGLATGRRQHSLSSTGDDDNDGTVGKAEANINTSRSNIKQQNISTNNDGLDNDCDGEVEITPMKGGQIKVKVTCK